MHPTNITPATTIEALVKGLVTDKRIQRVVMLILSEEGFKTAGELANLRAKLPELYTSLVAENMSQTNNVPMKNVLDLTNALDTLNQAAQAAPAPRPRKWPRPRPQSQPRPASRVPSFNVRGLWQAMATIQPDDPVEWIEILNRIGVDPADLVIEPSSELAQTDKFPAVAAKHCLSGNEACTYFRVNRLANVLLFFGNNTLGWRPVPIHDNEVAEGFDALGPATKSRVAAILETIFPAAGTIEEPRDGASVVAWAIADKDPRLLRLQMAADLVAHFGQP